MHGPLKILIGTAAAFALLRSSKRSEDAEGATDEEAGADLHELPMAATGFQGALDDAYERELLDRRPVDLAPYEDTEPTCGQFYQVQRGDTWLGAHERSIAYRALYRSAYLYATMRNHPDPVACAVPIAANASARRDLFDLCVSQSWGDEVYGTYLLSTKDPVGPHGRGIPLSRCCAENRLRIRDGEAVIRTVPRGQPEDRGIGQPNRKKKGASIGPIRLVRPYVWISAVQPDELLMGRVTTRRMVWEDGSTALEPPPCVTRLGMAVLT